MRDGERSVLRTQFHDDGRPVIPLLERLIGHTSAGA